MRFHIPEFFIDFKAMMKSVPYCMNTDGQTFGSSATSVFHKFGEKLSCYYYWSFPRRMLLSKVSAKYCTRRRIINTAIVFTWTRPRKTLYDSSWPTCNRFLKNLQLKSQGKVRSSWNQLFFGNEKLHSFYLFILFCAYKIARLYFITIELFSK